MPNPGEPETHLTNSTPFSRTFAQRPMQVLPHPICCYFLHSTVSGPAAPHWRATALRPFPVRCTRDSFQTPASVTVPAQVRTLDVGRVHRASPLAASSSRGPAIGIRLRPSVIRLFPALDPVECSLRKPTHGVIADGLELEDGDLRFPTRLCAHSGACPLHPRSRTADAQILALRSKLSPLSKSARQRLAGPVQPPLRRPRLRGNRAGGAFPGGELKISE